MVEYLNAEVSDALSKLGFTNQLDVILSRGAGMHEIDFSDLDVSAEWSDRLVCTDHVSV